MTLTKALRRPLLQGLAVFLILGAWMVGVELGHVINPDPRPPEPVCVEVAAADGSGLPECPKLMMVQR